jgi:hypothetical protein
MPLAMAAWMMACTFAFGFDMKNRISPSEIVWPK